MKCVFASCLLKYFMENASAKRQKSISSATHLIVALESCRAHLFTEVEIHICNKDTNESKVGKP